MNKTRSSFLVDFFGALSGEKIYVSALANDSTLKGKFPPKQIASTDCVEIDKFIDVYDVVGRGIFFCVSPIRGDAGASKNKDAVSSLVCLHADIDFKSIVGNRTSVLTALGRLGRAPTYTVVSGHGVHLYYLFSTPLMATPESVAQVENAARRLADVVGGDRQVAEVSRVMRMPGSHNSKDPDNIVRCEVIDASHKRYAFGDLVTWLGIQEPVIERVAKAEPVDKPSEPKVLNFFSQFGAENARGESLDLDALLESMYYPGNIHNTEVQMLSSLISRGENVDNAINFIIQGLLDHIPEAVSWNMEREKAELQKSAITWFVKHPDLMELQIAPPAWLVSNRAIRTKVLPHVKLAPSTSQDSPKPGPQTGAGSRVVDFTAPITNGTARKMDDPSEGEKEQPENKPEPEKADGATIHEFPKPGERVHLKTVQKAPPTPTVLIRSGEDLQRDPVIEPEWIVPNFVMRGALNGYFGDGGVGKDLTLMQLCISMATGKPWLGQNVKEGRTLYFNVEDNWQALRYRQSCIQANYGVDFNDYAERFYAATMVGQSTIIATFDSRLGMVKPTPLYDVLRKVIGELRPELVVVGNRVNIFSVNQNEDSQARQCLELLNALIVEFGCTIIMPGHVSANGLSMNLGTSGSVQWSNGMRHRLFLAKPKADNDPEASDLDKITRHLTVMKANWAAAGSEMKIAWHKDGLFVPAGDVEGFEVENLKPEDKAKRADEEFLRMLDLTTAAKVNVGTNNQSGKFAPRYFSKDKRCVFFKKGHSELEDAMNRLIERNRIKLERYGPPSDDTWRLTRT